MHAAVDSVVICNLWTAPQLISGSFLRLLFDLFDLLNIELYISIFHLYEASAIMTPKERVLKFDRSDADSEHTYILVNARSKGSKSLDVKLEAIDFESCFVTSRKLVS